MPRSAIATAHVDGADAESAVLAAIDAVDAADLGDLDAELAIGDVEDFGLGLVWQDTELPFLLELHCSPAPVSNTARSFPASSAAGEVAHHVGSPRGPDRVGHCGSMR